MRRSAGFLVGVMFLMLPVTGSADPRPTPAATFAPHGGAYITSLPSGAEVWMDGVYLGRTPAYVDDLLPGHHSLTVSRAGWNVQTAGVDVNVGQTTPISLVLQRIAPGAGQSDASKSPGLLSVRGAAGDTVYIDGVRAGSLPIDAKSVQGGFHIVTVTGKSTGRLTRVVDVFPDTLSVISVAAVQSAIAGGGAADDVLASLAAYLPGANVVIARDVVAIHGRGLELQCSIGSRDYTLNGKPGTFTIAPALVGGKVYLPLSLLQHLAPTP
ncbi:MAG TPA: PEGA domain-containing protein [Candidatus Eremiobacteraceae bacterium]